MYSFSPRCVGPRIYGYFHVHVHQRNGCNRCFSGCLQQNVGESVYAISSWSASAGYSASMLTRVAKVDSSSTRQLLAPSVNISVGYPALPDHDSMNNPSVPLSQSWDDTLFDMVCNVLVNLWDISVSLPLFMKRPRKRFKQMFPHIHVVSLNASI